MLDQSKLENVKPRGNKIIAACPACRAAGRDKQGNHLAIFEGGKFACVSHEGDSAHRSEIFSLVGIPEERGTTPKREKTIVATYDYTDTEGELIHQSIKYSPKGYGQRRPDGKGGWIWNMKDIIPVLYNLPNISKAGPDTPVWIVEGEKDADTLAKAGHIATTCPMGAGKWRDHYNDYLKGRHVIICPDNDDPGKAHASAVARSLKDTAASVRTIDLKAAWTACPTKGDVTDYINAGGDLVELMAQAREYAELSESEDKCDDLKAFIESRRFNESVVPEHQEPLVGLNDIGVIWRGNIHTLVAPSKAGKTAAMAAMMRTLCTGERCLGWTANKLQGKIVYLDFEQDAEDFYNVLAVQAGVTSGEVAAYRLAGLDPVKAQRATELILESTPDASMVMMDGYADLALNVNDTEESNGLAARWMDMTERHNIALLGVLHLNPSSDSKSRGHLGSQLERKSKTVLKIDVAKDGTRETYTQYARKAFIPQGHGVSWKWDDSEHGFVELTETKAEMKEAGKLETMTEKFKEFEALTMFSNWTFTDLRRDIHDKLDVSEPTAKNYIKYWSDNGLLTKTQKGYSHEPF